MTCRADRETNRYWEREAAKAYAERCASISARLAENGNRIEPWMRWQVSQGDFDTLTARAA